MNKEKTYSEKEINDYLKEHLSHWYFENGWIRRKYKTSGWKGTLMVISTIGHLAEAAWHHPDISASYAFVIVKLQNHAARGITDKDFLLAKKIESVIHWQPGTEEGTLEGTPEDPRFKYIKYDNSE
ncbi:MAG: pterin dehydratase [Gammaproteobacteria bacterium]|nr:pterin dehydratase [Gammaproteobacteria bacterium]|tara:strand:- start:1680 stop:2057 length:378 start_codon:yes stop_codon:yes gene_type:complete